MLSREERTAINSAFWQAFKTHSRKFKNQNGRHLNWVNYPTHIKQIYIRLYCNTDGARFSIDIQDKDEEIRELIWEQFIELKKVLLDEMIEPGDWIRGAENTAEQPIYRIQWELKNVSILKEEEHPKIFDFFMQYLLRFDQFYTTYDEILLALTK